METADLNTIARATLFTGMPDEQLMQILGNEPIKHYDKGHLLFQQGDEADAFFVVLSGWVKLIRLRPTGEEAVLHLFTSGETFAEVAMFGNHRYPATAETATPCRLLSISGARFEKIMVENPKLVRAMLASATLHLRNLVEEIEQLKARNSSQRLAQFIHDLCAQDKVSAVVKLPYEKNLIAARIGVQPESLSRILNKLRAIGVNCVNDQVVVSDVAALREFANSDS